MRKTILGVCFAFALALHAPAGAETESASAEGDAVAIELAELEAELQNAHLALGAAESAAALDPANPDLQAAIDRAMAGILEVEKVLDTAKQQHAENVDGA